MYNREYNRMPEYERHIEDEQMYRDAVRNLRKGERWKMEDLMARTDLNFNNEQFTPYDYSYMVNALYTDYDISEKPEQYMKMAKEHLRNNSFPERGGERAYYDAKKRTRTAKYDYDYEDRYDNRMRYDGYNRNYSERGSYKDRDNDRRYNE